MKDNAVMIRCFRAITTVKRRRSDQIAVSDPASQIDLCMLNVEVNWTGRVVPSFASLPEGETGAESPHPRTALRTSGNFKGKDVFWLEGKIAIRSTDD
ncbi:Hypothetical protein NTJ_10831 [Nesidiocoris tenuis]|uniref:Uncharacterized protein n=1 Tax=Nesidiocoris tenuis TaxID=355587 RepID=A0ABN7B0S2_9HEMI|nr:Hypothetical protein NTJ_10831 [Nesidiocoris tenuis]